MTRWARAGSSQKHKKMPEDPTSWEELSKGIKNDKKNKKGQVEQKESKSTENFIAAKNNVNDKFSKIELCNKNQNVNEKNCDLNSVDKDNNLEVDKTAEKCKIGEKTLSKRQLKKLKRQERKKMRTVSNSEFEQASDTSNICVNVSTENLTEEIGDRNETSKIETNKPISANTLSKKQLKKLKSKSKELSDKLSDKSEEKNLLDNDPKKVNSSPIEKKLKKKELFMRKLQERRMENGITLLSKTAENRLYRIKKRLREKGYTPEMIKDIIRKERRKAELEFRKTSFMQTCFNCGQPGHYRVDCQLPPNNTSQKLHTCAKCGSDEHKSMECTEKVIGHSFLTCFICKGQGHISKDCPNKKRPAAKEDEPLVALPTINEGESIDDEIIDIAKRIEKPKFKKPKVVVF